MGCFFHILLLWPPFKCSYLGEKKSGEARIKRNNMLKMSVCRAFFNILVQWFGKGLICARSSTSHVGSATKEKSPEPPHDRDLALYRLTTE